MVCWGNCLTNCILLPIVPTQYCTKKPPKSIQKTTNLKIVYGIETNTLFKFYNLRVRTGPKRRYDISIETGEVQYL